MKELQNSTKNLTLLYVEDDETIRAQFSITLEMLFKEVYIACNGKDGLLIYEKYADNIDLIATDIQMPIMNGLQMARSIKAINNDAHIIVISAHNDLDYFSEAIEIGVDGFIIKPVQSAQLNNVLFKSAKNLRLQKENKLYQEKLEDLVDEKTREIEQLYTHDKLTGCFNRQKLDEVLSENNFSSLMLINIDNFDTINSTYGYITGDSLLSAFADFLRKFIDNDRSLFRLAGDEFVIISKSDDVSKREALAIGIISALGHVKFDIEDFSIGLSCTIGVAANDMEQKESALVMAHAAMKETREIGKNRFHVYSSESMYIKKQKSNIDWMHKVRNALANDAVLPYFQSIVDNRTLKPIKYECLARLVDFNKIISPYYFIEPARLVGLLPKITEAMLIKSFAYFYDKDYEFSLNITEDDLKACYLPDLLKKLVDKHSIKPQMVTLEILENISAHGSEQALEQLIELKNFGFKLALDDFGSEKSNFFRLQKLNVDFIKIDGSFICDINTNKNNLNICKTIVNLADSLGCEVIAEFVHSREVFETVREIGISYSQGYFFDEPKAGI